MSRRRAPSGATISLFPFLAVLLCTMGALLVLLVIFSRRARQSELAASQAAVESRLGEMEFARDELRWRLEQLQGVRDRTAADLARERMRLAGVEEGARSLADELEALERTAAALEQAAPDGDGTRSVADAERRLAASRAALADARTSGALKPAAYAVVPYAGDNGTHRRPLYVECCIDGVFLQPEGIRLGPADFEGPPGPGNALASALRAAREHLARAPGETGDPAAQPYPLLLVRPSGVMAYYAAREALVSWGSEFGYQLVDEDWQLKFPPADPALAAVEQRAVEESRRRMEWLAQVRPARPTRPTQQYRAAPTRGGVVAEGGPTVIGDRSRFDWTDKQVSAGRQAGGGDGGGDGRGDGRGDGPGGGDVVLGAGTTGGAGAAAGGVGDRYAGPSRFYAGQPPLGGAAAGTGPGPGGPHATGSPTGGDAQDPGLATRTAVDGPGTASAGGGSGSTTGSVGGATAPGATNAGGGSSGSGAAGAANASAGAGGSAGGPALPGMMSSGGAAAAGTVSAAGSLAGARGAGWASLATAERPVPLRRPIRIECHAHEFRVFDDSGSRVETRVPIGTRTADSVDPLVRSVHERVGRWGLAGERMYWRPELVLSATTDGQARREDLERLLVDSGLDTRRADDDTEVRLLPPVTRTSAAGPRR